MPPEDLLQKLKDSLRPKDSGEKQSAREATIKSSNQQRTWNDTQQYHQLGKDDSATQIVLTAEEKTLLAQSYQKFEITGLDQPSAKPHDEPLRYTTEIQPDGQALHKVHISEPPSETTFSTEQLPDLSKIDLSQLSQDAQIGGPVGNWFRYLGRSFWGDLGNVHSGLQELATQGAADKIIFGSAVEAGHYYQNNSVGQVFQDVQSLAQDAAKTVWNAPTTYEQMSPEEKSKTSAEAVHAMVATFFFAGAKLPITKEVTEQMGLETMTDAQLKTLGIERQLDQAAEVAGKDSKLESAPELSPEKKDVSRNPEPSSSLVTDGGLSAHEGIEGAHAIKTHVGRTDGQLMQRAALMRDAASSFPDRATAERACTEAIEANRGKIEAFLKSKDRKLDLNYNCDFTTGRLVSKSTLVPENVKGVRLSLRRSSTLPSGYRIHTAYPIRETQL